MRGTAIARLWWLGHGEAFRYWLWEKGLAFSHHQKNRALLIARKRARIEARFGLGQQEFRFHDPSDQPPF